MSINKQKILSDAKEWFRLSIAAKHIKNTEKLVDPNEFNINPFTIKYLANFLTGNNSPQSIAKALIYPRVLGTSIATTFGMNMQTFVSNVLGAFGSTTAGIDIEFEDQLDSLKIYCQLKSGPETINSDDVKTIAGHFRNIINLGRANKLNLSHDQMVVGVLYGDNNTLSYHYERITNEFHHPVYAGQDFWHRLTGDPEFYFKLIDAIASIAIETNYNQEMQNIILKLSQSEVIQKLSL